MDTISFSNISLNDLTKIDFRTKQGRLILKQSGKSLSELKSYLFQKKSETKLQYIKKLMPYFKGYITRRRIRTYGICYLCPHLSVNDTDYWTLDDITKIKPTHFFSYKDEKGYYFSFEMKSLRRLLDKKFTSNPYNKQEFSEEVIENFEERWEKSRTRYNYNEKSTGHHHSQHANIKSRTIDIFSKMDFLDFPTNVEWFLGLTLGKLKDFYFHLEDIWFYRANLSSQERSRIMGGANVFTVPTRIVKHMTRISQLQEICLSVIDKFLSNSNDDSNRKLGCIYVLIAMTHVSHNARQAYPWLSL